MTTNSLNIFTDGGARGNPGPAACAFIVLSPSNDLVASGGKYLGSVTNNVAEYQGLLLAIDWLVNYSSQYSVSHVFFKLDSLLIVNQIKGLYKVKEPNLRALFIQTTNLLNSFSFPYTITHIPRSLNSQADLLVNNTLDNFSR